MLHRDLYLYIKFFFFLISAYVSLYIKDTN